MSDRTARELRRTGAGLPAELIDPHPSRMREGSPAMLEAHREAVAEGLDGYVDPETGMFCFTADYHWNKGSCCDLGCRHCPWVEADARLRQRHMRHGRHGD